MDASRILHRLVALVVIVLPALAGATPNVDGRWLFRRSDGGTDFVDITQSGNAVSFTYLSVDFSGTISDQGYLQAGAGGCPSPGYGANFDGDLSPDAAYLNARVLTGLCYDPNSFYTAGVFATRCECYDGNAIDGDGCDVECRVEPCWTCTTVLGLSTCVPASDGTACEDGAACTTGSTCSGGACGGGSPVVPCVDMTGRWFVRDEAPDFGFVSEGHTLYRQQGGIVVSGNDPPPAYGTFGTIDPATGTFAFQYPVWGDVFTYYNCSRDTKNGTVAADAATYDATGFSSVATTMHCVAFGYSEKGYRCGGGTLDPGEECDDGNRTDGDGCSASCTIEPCFGQPDGTPCDDGNACTDGDACQGGACAGSTVQCPACTSCDPVERCVARPRPSCRTTADGRHATLYLKNLSDDGRDAVRWRWPHGAATSLADLGSPHLTDGYALCIFDTASATPALLFRATAPARGTCGGTPCWTSRFGVGFDYRNPDATPDGTLSVRLRAGVDGKASAGFRGAGALLSGRPYGLPSVPPPLPLTVQLQGDGGACFEARYDAAGVLKSDAARGLFKARAQ